MYSVCLVEDDPDSRELFVDRLRTCKRLQLRGAYGNGEEALREVPKVNPDAVLMDIKLPGISGIDCLIALRRMNPSCNAAVVMLTAYEEGNLIFQALQAGAEGYLLKRHASARELEAAVVEVMAGGRPFHRTVAQKVTAFFQTWPPVGFGKDEPARRSGCREGGFHPRSPFSAMSGTQWNTSLPGSGVQSHPLQLVPLTPREDEVLKFVALGLTYKGVASELSISEDTVRTHMQSIFRKLRIHCRTDPCLYDAASSLGHSQQRPGTLFPSAPRL